ncbi:hypothetical protein V8C26DRAFT_368475 [Trichoderma gracile]
MHTQQGSPSYLPVSGFAKGIPEPQISRPIHQSCSSSLANNNRFKTCGLAGRLVLVKVQLVLLTIQNAGRTGRYSRLFSRVGGSENPISSSFFSLPFFFFPFFLFLPHFPSLLPLFSHSALFLFYFSFIFLPVSRFALLLSLQPASRVQQPN